MKKITIMFILFFVSLSFIIAHPSHIAVTRLVSPDNSVPLDYKEWKEGIANPVQVGIGNIGRRDRNGGKINVIVNSLLYPKLTYFLDPLTGQFITDLTNTGYSVSVDTMAMSSDPFAPDTLRNFLISEYGTGSVGAILIGDLPIAWFQMINRFWGSSPSYTDFPIDLFYMDLDGTWVDQYIRFGDSLVPGSDSIYDTHTGDMGPEIFVGRLTASTVGNDSAMLYEYFQRNHRYRVDSLNLSQQALFYIDDDWASSSFTWSNQLGVVYSSILVVDHPETTTANDYRTRIPVSHEWISLFAHSWPQGHTFKYNNGNFWSYFYSYEIPTIDPVGNFYNLFACSNARYTESQYSAGMYTFQNSYGLGALGSTKTGSMLEFQYFYNPLSWGYCLGDAFSSWFDTMGEAWGDTSRSWFYGMTLIADPTLTVIDTSSAVAETPDVKIGKIDLVIAPNPASHFVEFRLNGLKRKDIKLTVYSIDGRIMWQGRTENTSIVRWDCSKIPAGIYFCSVNTTEKRFSRKLVILK